VPKDYSNILVLKKTFSLLVNDASINPPWGESGQWAKEKDMTPTVQLIFQKVDIFLCFF
jgi:hypothetical protein